MKRIIISIIAGVAIMPCMQSIAPADPPVGQSIQRSRGGSFDHQNGRDPGAENGLNMTLADVATTTWDFLFNGRDRTPPGRLPSKPVDLAHLAFTDRDHLSVTWLGHSSLLINIGGHVMLTDPVFEKRVSVFGPTRFQGDVPLEVDALPEIEVVILSHDHYDHLNKHTVRFLKDKARRFVVPLGVGARIADWGVPRDRIVELDWWDEYRSDPDLMVAATPAQHFSGRGLTDRNRTLWASWVIRTPSRTLFFSGDSGYFDGFKQIGDRYGPFDMTFIECGAYDRSWAAVHMFPEQTVQAHLDLRGNVLHPIHWGTFNLALHPWYEPMQRLSAAAESSQVRVATPVLGDTTVYGKTLPDARWWEGGS